MTRMGTRLAGKTAIISGGASGMGRAQARLFAREGASVCIVDINKKTGEEVADGIRRAGGQAIYCRCDVRSAADWAAAVGAALDAFGQVTTLCNIAGSNVRNSFDEQTEEQWHFIVQTALTGAYLGIKAVVPAMRKYGHGSIINTGSLAVTHAGGNPAYSASKVGMLGLTVSTAAAYAADQIRCNLVSPDMWTRLSSGPTHPTAPMMSRPASMFRKTTGAGWRQPRWDVWSSQETSPRPSCSWLRTRLP